MNILIGFIFAGLIVAIPIFMQRTTYQSIDERKFKIYKLKKIGFLFKGMQGESSSSHGIILPMLIIQIQGYIVGILSFSLVVINEIIQLFNDSVLMVIIILFIHVFVVILLTVITGFISKKRK